MFVDLKNISPLVEKQFPSFYAEEGENFLQFMKAYYEWLDTEGPEQKIRRLGEYRDIDQTLDEYLKYFMSKYMYGIPKNILSNKKLLEKHILDLYRSKGTSEGMKLLFRLLYNTDIEIYRPQVDMLRTSDGKWVERKYIEVNSKNLTNHYSYLNKYVYGAASGAIAYVDEAIQLYSGNQISHILYITDLHVGINGDEFIVGEYLMYDGFTDISEVSTVLGSTRSATVVSSDTDNHINDTLTAYTESGRGLKIVVKKLANELYKGYLNFKLVNGGNGYTTDSIITYGTDPTGSGASFKIGSILNPTTIQYNDDLLQYYLNVSLNGNYVGVDSRTLYDKSTSPSPAANKNTILANALNITSLQVGTIGSISAITNGNHKYTNALQISVKEPRIIPYAISDGNGGIWGNNAIITAELAASNGTVTEVKVLSSGYGFNTQDEQILTRNSINNKEVSLKLNIDGVGIEEGYWEDNSGLLNSDKYIQDSYYYQEYSYEIQVEKSLDIYADVVKKVMHPVGNILFGKPLIIDKNELMLTLHGDRVNTNVTTSTLTDSNSLTDYVIIDNYMVKIIWDGSVNKWKYTSNGSIYAQ
jgi:hypothetical protein